MLLLQEVRKSVDFNLLVLLLLLFVCLFVCFVYFISLIG